MECWPTFHPPSLLSNSGPILNIPFIQEAFPDSRAGPGPPLARDEVISGCRNLAHAGHRGGMQHVCRMNE